jgi:hypothetical protein
MSGKAKPAATVRQPPAVQETLPGAEVPAGYQWVGKRGDKRGLVTRARMAQPDRVIAYLEQSLGRQLRQHCLDTRAELSATLGHAARLYLRSGESLIDPDLLDEVKAVAKRLGMHERDAIAQALDQWRERNTPRR